MHLVIDAAGTVTDCREKLNGIVQHLPTPETQEHKVIRMIAHYIVHDYLDPLHDPWAAECNFAAASRAAGSKVANPPEPKASFSIDCTVTMGDG